MISSILSVAFFGLLIYKSYQYMFYKPPNFPPGEAEVEFESNFVTVFPDRSPENTIFRQLSAAADVELQAHS